MSKTIDAHLHTWRLPRARGDSPYAWITPELGPLHRDFPPQEAGDVLAQSSISGAVLVQADDTYADTAAMLQVCDHHDWAVATVGWVPLDDPRQAYEGMQRWQGHWAFKGVRHLVHDDPRPDFLELPGVRESLSLLAEAGLPFDVPDAYPRHLEQVADLAEALPELTIVVDHLGKPPLAQGPGSADFLRWESLMKRIADCPQTVAKVSGLRIPGAAYDRQRVQPAIDVVLDAFGPSRLMYGGDWPMTVPGGGYRPTLRVLEEALAGLGEEDAQAIWHDTAARTYGLAGFA